MQRDEAQHLLELYRPDNPADRGDPVFAEALALLEADAELRAWFDAAQAVDRRISQTLGRIEGPDAAPAEILAGMRLHAHNAATPIDRPGAREPEPDDRGPDDRSPGDQGASANRRPSPWWRGPLIGLAAAAAVALTLLNLPPSSPSDPVDSAGEALAGLPGLPPVIEFLAEQVNNLQPDDFDMRSEEPEALRAFLSDARAPAPDRFPIALEGMGSIGCVTFDYGAATFSMVCFRNGAVYHFLVADKADYPGPLPTQPQTYQCQKNQKSFRVWAEGDLIKIIVVHGSKDNLPELI